jgi:hypothetical protein
VLYHALMVGVPAHGLTATKSSTANARPPAGYGRDERIVQVTVVADMLPPRL